MNKRLEPVDLAVAIGLLATILGGYLFFMATGGTLATVKARAAVPPGPDLASMGAMDFLQPGLGRLIVEDVLRSRETSTEVAEARRALSEASAKAAALASDPYGYIERLVAEESERRAAYEARGQHVLGRFIVDSTARGVKMGALSAADSSSEFNRWIVRTAKVRKARDLPSRFQSNLGQAILTATRGRANLVQRAQERLGEAIVRLTSLRHAYEQAAGWRQEQLGALIVAAIRTELANANQRVASRSRTPGQTPLPLTEPRTWPEVPIGGLFGAAAVLIGVFLGGLVWAMRQPEPAVTQEMTPEVPGAVYRKTA